MSFINTYVILRDQAPLCCLKKAYFSHRNNTECTIRQTDAGVRLTDSNPGSRSIGETL